MKLDVRTKEKIHDVSGAAKILTAVLSIEHPIDRDREHFWVIGLTAKNGVKFVELVSLGTLTASLIHPRETYRLAIMEGVANIIVGHNHPSGDTTPSREDASITQRLYAAGEILGIKLLDHVIIAENGEHFSMLAKGLLSQEVI